MRTPEAVFSQGTFHPEQAHAAWGFVLCCGLFALRGGAASAHFLEAVRERARVELDDQAAVNLVLLESGMRWQQADAEQVEFAGRVFSTYRTMLRGRSETLGLDVGLLPHHRVARVPEAAGGAIVRHPASPREPRAKIQVLRQYGVWHETPEKRPQILVFSYHKSGTTLFHRVMHRLAERLGRSIRVQYGMANSIDPTIDIVLLPHSLLGFELARDYRAVRIVRDPRDIWLSGYLYHCLTDEGWCVNANLDPRPPITYPRVDFSMQHRPERWKRRWLESLSGRSYQQNLRERDRDAGLAFELDGYTGCTLAAMRAWRPLPNAIDVKLEDIMRAFDATMQRVFRHLGFTDEECAIAMEIAAGEDINRMDDATIGANPHIHSRELSKWRDMLTAEQARGFERRYGDLVVSFGYELSG